MKGTKLTELKLSTLQYTVSLDQHTRGLGVPPFRVLVSQAHETPRTAEISQ